MPLVPLIIVIIKFLNKAYSRNKNTLRPSAGVLIRDPNIILPPIDRQSGFFW